MQTMTYTATPIYAGTNKDAFGIRVSDPLRPCTCSDCWEANMYCITKHGEGCPCFESRVTTAVIKNQRIIQLNCVPRTDFQ